MSLPKVRLQSSVSTFDYCNTGARPPPPQKICYHSSVNWQRHTHYSIITLHVVVVVLSSVTWG